MAARAGNGNPTGSSEYGARGAPASDTQSKCRGYLWATMGLYRRLLGFLRPHVWRLAAAIASNIVGAVLDAFTFTLLIPFLNALFDQDEYISSRLGWFSDLQQWLIGSLLDKA